MFICIFTCVDMSYSKLDSIKIDNATFYHVKMNNADIVDLHFTNVETTDQEFTSEQLKNIYEVNTNLHTK